MITGLVSMMAGLIIVQTSTGKIEHYNRLGWVVVVAMLLTLVLMYNVNRMIRRPAVATA